MTIFYRSFQPEDFQAVAALVKLFYQETPGNATISIQKIKKTFREFTTHPEKGTIVICKSQKKIVGYAILFRGWSNEAGKNLLFIDELYVEKSFRNQGIASGCLKYILKKYKKSATALMLAVEPGNEKVEKLYRKIGFKTYPSKTLIFKF